MSSKRRSRLACIECKQSKQKCEHSPSYKRCKRCIKHHLACIPPPIKKKHAFESPNLISNNQISGKELSLESLQSLEKDNPRLSDTCACCRRDKKRCEYNGIPGALRCARCRMKKRQCLFQCAECHEKNNVDKVMLHCVNCKTTVEDPPVDYNFVQENDKIYLKLENNDIKIEITHANNNTPSVMLDTCPSASYLPVYNEASNICIQPIILQGSYFISDAYQQQTVNDLSLYYNFIN
ncbi:2631_t:CDS:2 [Racocetra persica]|uniref:2631_t:CDS:1 n=1 Tax=Racocetra persica TaxID=160502 RepID=A0ACA9NA60_9GLOM|nr:2631_t:CDS:2 [Racocetra persica]